MAGMAKEESDQGTSGQGTIVSVNEMTMELQFGNGLEQGTIGYALSRVIHRIQSKNLFGNPNWYTKW